MGFRDDTCRNDSGIKLTYTILRLSAGKRTEQLMKRTTTIIFLLFSLLAGSAFGQSWQSGLTSGITSAIFSRVGNDYTIVLTNTSGTVGDNTTGYDVLVWTLQPFNLPTPEQILTMPQGWSWSDGHWSTFGIGSANSKYYTPPAIAPGGSVTFKFTSTLSDLVRPRDHHHSTKHTQCPGTWQPASPLYS